MSKSSFESLSALQTFLSKSSREEFQQMLPLFSLSELTDSLLLLQTQPILEAKSKLSALFELADSNIKLEILGRNFSRSSFISFLDFLAQYPQYQNRLTLILVGLNPPIFSQALHFLQDHHLFILRQEGTLEPLHYQLTQFAHEGESLQKNIEKNALQLQQELSAIKPEELNQQTLQEIKERIHNLRDQEVNYLESANIALAIAWHTNRTDLIEKLSSLTETMKHQLNHTIGHSSFHKASATGLYAFLQQLFSTIFDSSLKDEDAAIEGMTRLSIWHLKDYWEIGLLPSVEHPEELNLNSQQYSENERWAHQQQLISLVQLQLKNLGIEKIKDLKKLHLFSKSLLKEYIKEHRHLLLNV